MTKRETAAVIKRRTEVNIILRGLKRAEELELTKPLDIAECIQLTLSVARDIKQAGDAFLRHLKADPHCTCNDCTLFHQMTSEGYNSRQALALMRK